MLQAVILQADVFEVEKDEDLWSSLNGDDFPRTWVKMTGFETS